MACVTCGLPWLWHFLVTSQLVCPWLKSSLVCEWRYYLNFHVYDKVLRKNPWVNAWEPSPHDTSTRDRYWFLDCFTLDDGTYMLSRNVVKRLPIYAAQNLARGKPLLQVVVVIRRYVTWDHDSVITQIPNTASSFIRMETSVWRLSLCRRYIVTIW